jgi:hypothetical protein
MRKLILGLLLSLLSRNVGADMPATHFEVSVQPQRGKSFVYNTTGNTGDSEIPLPAGLAGAKWRCIVKATTQSDDKKHAAQLLLCTDTIVSITQMAACPISKDGYDANQIGLHLAKAMGSHESVYITQTCYTNVGSSGTGLPTQHI